MAGYSGTPLAKKLGIKENFRLFFFDPPKTLRTDIGDLPDNARIATKLDGKPFDLIMLFATSERVLKQQFPRLMKSMNQNGMLWVAWPKKSSGVETDLSEKIVQHFGLDSGLVDVKICAVDDTWSGLKFVYRLKDRKK